MAAISPCMRRRAAWRIGQGGKVAHGVDRQQHGMHRHGMLRAKIFGNALLGLVVTGGCGPAVAVARNILTLCSVPRTAAAHSGRSVIEWRCRRDVIGSAVRPTRRLGA
jgi:hypothetical protein